MRKILAVAMFILALTAGFGQLASADPGNRNDQGYHAQGNSCDSGHGAFGAFSHHTGSWIPTDAKEDGGLGHDTGPVNSGFSQYCRTQ